MVSKFVSDRLDWELEAVSRRYGALSLRRGRCGLIVQGRLCKCEVHS